MSELITANNLDLLVKKNEEIRKEIEGQVIAVKTNSALMKVAPTPYMGLLILQGFGLVQMPIGDEFWSGAIFVKDGKLIPVINTALPRVNQCFASWHEVYHLLFDEVSFDYFVETNNILEERKAEYFAACMLLNGVERYFIELPVMDFVSKIFCCMSVFMAPYKAVLISLYEFAVQSDNEKLMTEIKDVFDYRFEDLPEHFRRLGLDDSLVEPSFVVNTLALNEKIRKKKEENPELQYHKDNEDFLENIKKEIEMMKRNMI